MLHTLYGDGIHDDYPAIQEMLDSGMSLVYLPAPKAFYVISKSLKIHSNQELRLDRYTKITLAKMSNCAMATNAEPEEWNKNITITGGIWDMNHNEQYPNPLHFQNPETGKKFGEALAELNFDHSGRVLPDLYFGECFRFSSVRHFCIENLTITNPVVYGARLAFIEHFRIENITFDYTEGSPKLWNMDGIHLEGGSKHGYIHNLHGACHDDMVALTADDILYSPIEDITIDGIYANNSHSAVRLLSAKNRVSNIHISNIYGTYYVWAIILSKHYNVPNQGWYENITIDNVYASFCEGTVDVKGNWAPLIYVEHTLDISNLSLSQIYRKEAWCTMPTIGIGPDTVIKNLSITDAEQVNETGKPITFLNNEGRIEKLRLYNVETNGDTMINGEERIEKIDIY